MFSSQQFSSGENTIFSDEMIAPEMLCSAFLKSSSSCRKEGYIGCSDQCDCYQQLQSLPRSTLDTSKNEDELINPDVVRFETSKLKGNAENHLLKFLSKAIQLAQIYPSNDPDKGSLCKYQKSKEKSKETSFQTQM